MSKNKRTKAPKWERAGGLSVWKRGHDRVLLKGGRWQLSRGPMIVGSFDSLIEACTKPDELGL